MKISELPEPYRSMALANQKLQGNEPNEEKDLGNHGKKTGGFNWSETKEGIKFWDDVWYGKSPELTPEIKKNYPEIFNLVTLTCMGCGEWFKGEAPKMCCSGRDCGCMGMPTEPVICSPGCYGLMKLKVKNGGKIPAAVGEEKESGDDPIAQYTLICKIIEGGYKGRKIEKYINLYLMNYPNGQYAKLLNSLSDGNNNPDGLKLI